MKAPLAAVAALPGVPDAIDRALRAIDEVIAASELRRHGPAVAAESALRGARASAALDGVDIDLEFLRSGNLRLDHPGRPVVQAALRLTQEVPQLDAVWRRAPLEALARLHLVAAADLARDGDDSIGRPRTDVPTGRDGPGPAEVAHRLQILADTVRTDRRTPGVVVAAVVHGELLALQPFGTRDALVARAAERLVLRTRGADPRGLTIPEVGHLGAGRADYAEAAAGFARDGAEGVARWVERCARAYAAGAAEAAAAMRGIAHANGAR